MAVTVRSLSILDGFEKKKTFKKEREKEIFVCDDKLIMNMVIKQIWLSERTELKKPRNSLNSCFRISFAGVQVATNTGFVLKAKLWHLVVL